MAAASASTSIHPARAKFARQRQSCRHSRLAGEDIRHGQSPLAADALVEVRTDATINRAAIDAHRLDERSRAWLDALDSHSLHREEAIGRLHALLLREARFEVGRRTASLAHPSGIDLDDLAVQAADDAVVAILAKLDQFRGDSLFTTWARNFVRREVPGKIRRRRGHARELPTDEGFDHAQMWAVNVESPHERAVARETARTLAVLIADDLTPRQREVLIALAIEGVPTKDLARRLDTTPGALYKTLHDARRKLRANLVAA
ncbi:MAG TPA: sigma-70 family RNA polymerase sigma factor [Solirubrobacteraceae bacterium]|nr:sigma-70 family RNA polymerase sigma factor [Solirubrobacteraceae bacterium]